MSPPWQILTKLWEFSWDSTQIEVSKNTQFLGKVFSHLAPSPHGAFVRIRSIPLLEQRNTWEQDRHVEEDTARHRSSGSVSRAWPGCQHPFAPFSWCPLFSERHIRPYQMTNLPFLLPSFFHLLFIEYVFCVLCLLAFPSTLPTV